MMMRIRVRGLVTYGFVALSAGCTQVYTQPAAAPAGSPQASAKPDSSDTKKAPFKKWDEVLKDTEKREGFFDTHLKRDNTLYMEIDPARLGEDFGLVMHFSKGVGVFNAHDGLPLSNTQLMRFTREGDKLYLIHMNANFTADAGSAMRRSLDENVGNSVVEDFAIESVNEETGALLIDVTSLFVSDYSGVTNRIKVYYGNKPVSVDKDRSWVDAVQAFPDNIEVDAALTLAATERPTSFGSRAGVSDYRSVPIGVRYSLFKLPEEPMQRRYADDRVGHFVDAQKDFSRDQEKDRFVRYVNRWRLEKKDDGAALSEPVEPIVYYIDRTVPVRYQKWVREGIEAWNKAYEAAGFKGAIVAKVAPTVEEDSTWSAEDIRYSTVRWSAAHQMGYAIGPSQTDPRTGELLNADILISSNFVVGYFNDWEQIAGPETLIERMDRAEELRRMMDPALAQYVCAYEIGKTQQLQFQHAALTALGVIDGTAPLPDEFLGPALRDLIMHEVGHTLGLRHNMKGSSAIPFERLNDTEYTRENGVTLSVMDYGAVNINPDRARQGDYVNEEVGAYDVWAIRYAYQPIYQNLGSSGLPMSGTPVTSPEAELPGLMRIAGESTELLNTYGTDEDVGSGSWGVDPMSNTWDLSADPFKWAEERARLIALVQPELEGRMIAEGEGYARLRGAIQSLIGERWLSLRTVVRLVGGIDQVRDHRGQPGARSPFTPVSAERQREALAFLVDQAFDEDAWNFEAGILNKLPPNRFFDWSVRFGAGGAVDFPVHQQVIAIQTRILSDLLNTARLTRIIDNSVRMPENGEAYSVAELMGTLTGSIFSELGAAPRAPRNANSFRRNLQRKLLDQYVALLMGERPSANYPTPPEDARSLARYELKRLAERMEGALQAGGLDTVNTAHLEESVARIERALEASMSVEVG
jgi:Met-zincin/Domain of unknown function (DUF5117)/Domain of unknown function (DUF5118)